MQIDCHQTSTDYFCSRTYSTVHIKGQNYFYNKNQNLFDVMFVCGNMNLIDFTVIKVINYITFLQLYI